MPCALKSISREAVGSAIEKAQHYRLLNEPSQAESICLDVLAIDPENQQALVTLILALTDQFGRGKHPEEVREYTSRLGGQYEQHYYSGIVAERTARWHLRQGAPGARFDAFEFFQDAMRHYEKAEEVRPPGNDDALLRWNTCARYLQRNPEIQPRPQEAFEPILSE